MRFNKIYLEITNICNLSCSFCHGTERTPSMMTEAQFDTLTDRIRGYTEFIYYHLMGEPLLHPELPGFLTMAKKKGFKSIITTNGILLEQCGDDLIATGALHKVNISLQAFEGNRGSDPDSYVRSCAYFAEKASDKGVICVMRLWNIHGADSLNGRIVDVLKAAFPGDWKEARNGFKLADRVYLEYAGVFDWPDINAEEVSSSGYCYGLKDQLGVLCDGTVVPCCLDSDGVIRLGNLFENSMEEILSSNRVEDILEGFRNRSPSEELCRKCGYSTRFDK